MAAAALILSPAELEELLERAAERGAERAMARGTSGVLSTAAAAHIAGRSEETIRDWIAAGVLPAKKRGRSWAILRPDLDRYLAGEHAEGAPSSKTILESLSRGGSGQPS